MQEGGSRGAGESQSGDCSPSLREPSVHTPPHLTLLQSSQGCEEEEGIRATGTGRWR